MHIILFSWEKSRLSSTTPLNESQFEAMDYKVWRMIGEEVLMKSNIVNWFACNPKSGYWSRGNIVTLARGPLNCRVLTDEILLEKCKDKAPAYMQYSDRNPSLYLRGEGYVEYFFYDLVFGDYSWSKGARVNSCGKGASNIANAYKPGVSDPQGHWYVR